MWLVWKLRLPQREAGQPGPGCQGLLFSKREVLSLSATAGKQTSAPLLGGQRVARRRGRPHLGAEQQEEQVLGRGAGPPAQHVGQEQELRGARGALSAGGFPPAREAPPPPSHPPLPSSPGHCPPGETAPSPRPERFSSQRPGSQQPWRLVQPLENEGGLRVRGG